MKTIIKIQETGNRKYKKVMVKVFSLFLGLILNSSTVSSQNSFEMGKLTNARDARLEQPHHDATLLVLAHHSVIAHSSPTAVAISSFKIEPMEEKGLEIEGWMTDLSNFGQMVHYADEKEEPLEVKEWMMNELNFSTSAITFTVEREPEMQVENWMVSERFWRR